MVTRSALRNNPHAGAIIENEEIPKSFPFRQSASFKAIAPTTTETPAFVAQSGKAHRRIPATSQSVLRRG